MKCQKCSMFNIKHSTSWLLAMKSYNSITSLQQYNRISLAATTEKNRLVACKPLLYNRKFQLRSNWSTCPPMASRDQLIMRCSWADGCAWETTFLVAILKTLSGADRTKKSFWFHPSAAENDTSSGRGYDRLRPAWYNYGGITGSNLFEEAAGAFWSCPSG